MCKKLAAALFGLFLTCNSAFANLNGKIEKVISDSGINSAGVSVSVKDVKSGLPVAQHHPKQPMMPASTQKMLTYPAVMETLGEDYKFTTQIFKTADNDVYLKLSADPYLSATDLKALTKALKPLVTCREFYIDDTIIDSEDWGEGWQWDNDLNPLMPRYSVYNLDKNLLTLVIRPTIKGSQADIRLTEFYPLTIVNLVTTGDADSVKMSRKNNISPDILTLEGTVKKQVIRTVPVNNPKRYFMMRLDEAVKAQKFDYYGEFPSKSCAGVDKTLLTEVSHSLQRAGVDILKNSNNYVAETVYKLAGGKFKNASGTTEGANEMFLDYCKRHNLDTSDIRIVDGSGVSKNNIMTADFATSFLLNEAKQDNFETYYNSLAKPSEGTLKNRMLYFTDKLRAKTGSLSDVSAIAGYLTTQKGNMVAFDIMINDHKLKSNKKKILEEEILKTIYVNY